MLMVISEQTSAAKGYPNPNPNLKKMEKMVVRWTDGQSKSTTSVVKKSTA